MHNVAGVSIAAFGLINAVVIMASAVFLATALGVAKDPSLAPAGDAAAAVGLLNQLSTNSWGIGALFFGLWLIPMGWTAIATGRFPRALGWILVVGGGGYLLSGLIDYGVAGAPNLLIPSLTPARLSPSLAKPRPEGVARRRGHPARAVVARAARDPPAGATRTPENG